jgi:hypothetical protein
LGQYKEEQFGLKTPYLDMTSLYVATLALGSQPKQRDCKVAGQEKARELRPRDCKGPGQEEAREPRQEEVWELSQEDPGESHHILPGV